ncbi:MAG: chloride channel protein, partial [Planctomycetota bacterium]|nr:chloride channel protein [Planctomycetota bacterium]
MLKRAANVIRKISTRLGLQRDWYLIAIGAGIGTVTAFGAILFVKLLHLLTDASISIIEESPWWVLPLVPMARALVTGVIVHLFAAEARGHGVPEVMDALYSKGGRIRSRVAVVKGITSALTIGSGGSAGAEGPIVQIGSAIGSWMAQTLRVSRDHAGTLVGCGAAAGIASVFNAPIAGVFFVLEILLRDFSLRTFTPIVIASVFSATVTQAVLGANEAIFNVSGLSGYVFSLPELPSYALLGLICGFVAVLFIKMLYASEDLAARVRIHPIIKPVIGAALLGVLGIAFIAVGNRVGVSQTMPAFFGNGYDAIVHLLEPANYGPEGGSPIANAAAAVPGHPESQLDLPTELWLLVVLLGCKLVATCLTLGSGGSGGVFAPSLFLGASSGAAVGVALESLGLLPPESSPAAYALVGMAALVAGTTHAPLTAFLIVFEITRDPYVLLPIMLAAVISTVVAQLVMRDSI